jgi:hypothetical protein
MVMVEENNYGKISMVLFIRKTITGKLSWLWWRRRTIYECPN